MSEPPARELFCYQRFMMTLTLLDRFAPTREVFMQKPGKGGRLLTPQLLQELTALRQMGRDTPEQLDDYDYDLCKQLAIYTRLKNIDGTDTLLYPNRKPVLHYLDVFDRMITEFGKMKKGRLTCHTNEKEFFAKRSIRDVFQIKQEYSRLFFRSLRYCCMRKNDKAAFREKFGIWRERLQEHGLTVESSPLMMAHAFGVDMGEELSMDAKDWTRKSRTTDSRRNILMQIIDQDDQEPVRDDAGQGTAQGDGVQGAACQEPVHEDAGAEPPASAERVAEDHGLFDDPPAGSPPMVVCRVPEDHDRVHESSEIIVAPVEDPSGSPLLPGPLDLLLYEGSSPT